MTTGEKIRQRRKELGMTQEDLGNLIGVQKAAINKYETGIVVNLKRSTISALARALHVSPVYLISSDEPPDDHIVTPEARILAKGIDKLPQEQREQALAVIRAMFVKYSDFFDKELVDDN